MVESVERPVGRHGKGDRFPGGLVVDLDARPVVVGVPVEGDLEAAVDALGEFAKGDGGQC
jgi:hypothetical protein